MPVWNLKKIPFPNKLDALSMVANLRTAWENFIKIDTPSTLTITASGTTVLTAVSQAVFANCAAGNVALTVASAAGNTGLTYTIFKTDSTTNTLTVNGIVLGGNLGVSRLVLVSNGTSYLTEVLYDEGTYPATLTGCTTSPSVTVSYCKSGSAVHLRMTALFASSNTTACTITGMPAHIRPSSTLLWPILTVLDNSLDHPGGIKIDAAGLWTLYFYSGITTLTTTFTNANNKGTGSEIAISYLI